MSRAPQAAAEAQAQRRFVMLQLARVGGLAVVLTGLAIVRGRLDLPWVLGAGLAVGGLLGFYFLPRFMARAWKAGDEKRR